MEKRKKNLKEGEKKGTKGKKEAEKGKGTDGWFSRKEGENV